MIQTRAAAEGAAAQARHLLQRYGFRYLATIGRKVVYVSRPAPVLAIFW